MQWKLLNGKVKNFNPAKYKIDWNHKVSGPQFAVTRFLYPYWKNHVVLSEMVIPGSRKRYDLVNLSLKIIIEVSPDEVHLEFNKFMHGSRAGYLKKLKSDYEKMQMAEKNDFIFIELYNEHIDNLSKEMFLEKFDLSL
jgi:hypothetical protein